MSQHLQTFSLFLILSATLVVISIFIALGFYAYPAADDFCMVSGVEKNGLFSHLWEHYQIWSGRYSGNAFYALYPILFGFFHGYPIIALILILLLLLGASFFLSKIFQIGQFSPAVLLVALGFVSVYLLGLRHTASSLYWMAGALTYQTANILLLFAMGHIVQFLDQQRISDVHRASLLWMLLIIVLGMGTNENNMIVLLGLIGLVLMYKIKSGWQQLSPWLLIMLLALVCFVIVYFAPGNAERESTFPLRHDWSRSIEGSWNMGKWTLMVWTGNPVFLAASLLLPFAVMGLKRRSHRRFNISWLAIGLLLVATLSLPFILQFPAWWSMGGWPPPRTIDAIFFVFLLSWLLFLGGLTLAVQSKVKKSAKKTKRKMLKTGALLLSVLLFIGAISINGKLRRAYQDLTQRAPVFDRYMQDRHAQIYEALERDQVYIKVPAFNRDYPRSIFFNDIRTDPRDWRNVCYAQQFGLQGIALERRQ